jgi:CBS domain-containing protein
MAFFATEEVLHGGASAGKSQETRPSHRCRARDGRSRRSATEGHTTKGFALIAPGTIFYRGEMPLLVKEAMTRQVQSVSPHDVLQKAAEVMRSIGVGCVPVLEDGEPVGIVTDRDLAVRAVALGWDPTATAVRDVMTPHPVVVAEGQMLDEAITTMINHRISRVLVTNREGRLAGILTSSDAAVFCPSPREISSLMTHLSARDRKSACAVNAVRPSGR